jgi:thiol-disulfide isomerase/thioredoxin
VLPFRITRLESSGECGLCGERPRPTTFMRFLLQRFSAKIICCGHRILPLLALLAASTALADAPPGQPEALPLTFTVADITLGETVAGESLTPESLAHRVVLVEFWEHTCKNCLASMPLMEQVYRTHGSAGLLVIAAHRGKGSSVEVRETAEKVGISFPVVIDSSIKGLSATGYPHVVLFDHTGACIARGSPRDVMGKLNQAVSEAPPLVLAGRHLEKLAPLERMLRDESKYGVVLRKADGMVESDDETTAEEAKFVIERLNGHAEAQLAKAEELKTTDAYEAASLLQRVATAYRGNDSGKRAMEMQREWKRDKPFNDALQAAQLTSQLEALRQQAVAQASMPRGGGYGRQQGGQNVASMSAAAKIPPAVKGQLAQMAGMVLQLSPGSKYASRAEAIALELGLTLPASP